MCLAGIPLAIIKKWGRWESDCIFKYCLETPIAVCGATITSMYTAAKRMFAYNPVPAI
jgi:hypothetical protein